ncbi:MAG: hypothetical protein QXH26_03710 [Candidatus Hadarchaeales archaeon]
MRGRNLFILGLILIAVTIVLIYRGGQPHLVHTVMGAVGSMVMGVGLGRMVATVITGLLFAPLFVAIIFGPPLAGAWMQASPAVGTMFLWFLSSLVGVLLGWGSPAEWKLPSFHFRLPSFRPKLRRGGPEVVWEGFSLPRVRYTPPKYSVPRFRLPSFRPKLRRGLGVSWKGFTLPKLRYTAPKYSVPRYTYKPPKYKPPKDIDYWLRFVERSRRK